MKHYLLFLGLLITPPLAAMEISGIKKAITVAFLKKRVAIGGENGCAIFDATSGTLLKKLTYDTTYSIAANKNKQTLAVLHGRKLSCFDVETGKAVFDTFHRNPATLAFNANDLLYTYIECTLQTYDIKKTYSSAHTLEWEPGATPITTISCHPTKNEIVYPSKSNRLSIAQPSCSPLIKTHLQPTNLYYCQAGQYSPDGRYIAINENVKKCFIYDMEQNTCLQLCADNQEYLAMAFSPVACIIALLSRDNAVHYFNYKTGRLIATTFQLTPAPSQGDYKNFYNRLAFSKTSYQLVVAPQSPKCLILNAPCNCSTLIYHILCQHNMPKELQQIIIHFITQNIPCLFYSLDWSEIIQIEPITTPIKQSNTDEFPMELETDIRKFTATNLQ